MRDGYRILRDDRAPRLSVSHPAIPFLLLLAIADDALGLVILALFYPSGSLSPVWLGGLMSAALLTALWFAPPPNAELLAIRDWA